MIIAKKSLIAEIMWEYNCNRKRAEKTVESYIAQGKYRELCEIVAYKRKALVV